MTIYYIFAYLAILFTAAGHILLKMGANQKGIEFRRLSLNLNHWVSLALLSMIASMLMNLRALSIVPLRDMAFILPTVYILVPLFACLFLKERLNRQTIFGTLLIILGIIVFNFPTMRIL